MHRERYFAQEVYTAPTDRILFTTYTKNLADNIGRNLADLCGAELAGSRSQTSIVGRRDSWLRRAFTLRSQPMKNTNVGAPLALRRETGFGGIISAQRMEECRRSEGITERAAYLQVSRVGRGRALTRPQRAAIWSVFEEYRRQLAILGKVEWLEIIRQARLYLARLGNILPYRAIIVDETQDWAPEELRLLRQMVPAGPNDLFLVGDAHQRIYGTSCNARPIGDQRPGPVEQIAHQLSDDRGDPQLVGRNFDRPASRRHGRRRRHPARILSLLHGDFPIVRSFPTLSEELDFLAGESSPCCAKCHHIIYAW